MADPLPIPLEDWPRIVGSDRFTSQVLSALHLLAERAPEAFVRVVEAITTIQSVPASSGMDVFSRTFYVGDVTAFTPGFSPSEQLVWLAGTIVHDACHSEQHAEGRVSSGKEAEVECLATQLEALSLIDEADLFGSYISHLIATADDPASQYWNESNRQW